MAKVRKEISKCEVDDSEGLVDIAKIEIAFLKHHEKVMELLDARLSHHEEILNSFARQWASEEPRSHSCSLAPAVQPADAGIKKKMEEDPNIGELSATPAGTKKSYDPRLSSYESMLKEDQLRKTKAEALGVVETEVVANASDHRSDLQGLLISITKDRRFELTISCVIICNALLLGVEVEYLARSKRTASPTGFKIVNWCFSGIFIVELLLRIFAEGYKFFLFSEKIWNLFDTVVVLCSILEFVIDVVAVDVDADSAKNTKLVRVGRIVRTMRIYRSLRVASIIRFLSAFQILILSIGACLKSLMWAIIMMVMIVYVFGLVFTQATTNYLLEGNGTQRLKEDPILEDYWGSLGDSMFTLYKCITGGINWHDVVVPLGRIGSFWVGLFTIYMTFTYFAVLNVVTGVFCNSAIETGRRDPDMVVQTMQSEQKWASETLKQLFDILDTDKSGHISLLELKGRLHDEEVRALFNLLDLEIRDAWGLFKLIDTRRDHVININEFMKGCLELRGGARNLDLATLRADCRNMLRLMSGVATRIETVVLEESAKRQAHMENLHHRLSNNSFAATSSQTVRQSLQTVRHPSAMSSQELTVRPPSMQQAVLFGTRTQSAGTLAHPRVVIDM